MDDNSFARKRLQKEFSEFNELSEAKAAPAPESVSTLLISQVRSDLNPSASAVFVKVTLLHLLVGFCTLALCPQFGLSLTSSMGLMHYLMRFGETVCMMGCGVLFMGASLLAASLILKPEEVKVIRRNRVLQLTSLATLSLGAFVCFGADVVLGLGIAWALGAILGGAGTLQLGWALRRWAVEHAAA